ncbi:hypothetical protein BN946_scf185033.g52 [Trametes cinnabarina]|uniref:Homeobox domain-containing protein n=1 Tax=Pycnoporus cinnabarinus TaxID=5643 RepID=A0A060SR80_PYCCI|nr:hypothetical protein BN946_scf185033.g52 [Trametes cinnabarina]
MADTEMEAGPSKATTSESAPEGPPPKKKRTRTLTTPHQAAVLHALLAQSRFPTTQMREEVGRAIGLSARKVQVRFLTQRFPLKSPISYFPLRVDLVSGKHHPVSPYASRSLTASQNQRQKARRPRGQAATSAPLTRPPQFGPFTNAPPPGFASTEVTPTATTLHSGSSLEGFLPRAPGGLDMPYGGASAPSRAADEQFARSHRDPYLAEDYARSNTVPSHLAGPGIPGPSRRPPYASGGQSMESGGWRGFGSAAGEQGPGLPLSLPPVSTNIPRPHALATSPIGGPPLSLVSIGSLEAGAGPSSRRPSTFDDRARALPQPNVDFSAPRTPLNIPPPFTLQPQPQWDDPAFSPFNARRRSSPALPQSVPSQFGGPSTSTHTPYRGEPLPSISAVVSMGHGPSSLRSPRSPPRAQRFDPIRSSAGRAQPEHSARPGFHDFTDEPPPPTNR